MAKVLSFTSSNPKMGGSAAVKVKGYAQGGIVGEGRLSLTRIDSPEAPAAPVAPADPNAGKTIEYSAYDTTMEAEAKAPVVGYGQAPKVSAMADVAKPGDVNYYGEQHKQAATELNQKRWDAYNRRLQNEAIRTGNVAPGSSQASEVMNKEVAPIYGSQAAVKQTIQASAGSSTGVVPTNELIMGKVISQTGITRSAPSAAASASGDVYSKKKKKDD